MTLTPSVGTDATRAGANNKRDELQEIDEVDFLADLRARQDRARPAGTPRAVSYPFGDAAFSEYLRRWAEVDPARIALTFYGRDFTYADVDDLSDRFAGWLAARGLGPGDRVGVALPNCPQFVIAFHAILKLGGVYVPVNPMQRAQELRHELTDAGPRVLVALNTLHAELEPILSGTDVVEVLYLDFADLLAESPRPVPPAALWPTPPGVPGSRWREVVAGERYRAPLADRDAVAALNYTGGTMGLPKGCEHSQRHMLYTGATTAAAWNLGEHYGGTAEDVSLVFMPVFWIGGEDLALVIPIVSGTRCVLMARWDVAGVLQTIEANRVTHMVGAVDSYVEILEYPKRQAFDVSSLRLTLGASFVRRLDVEVREQWRNYAGPRSVLREGAFGMTETHSMDTSTAGFQDDDADLRARPVFCGLPVPGTEIKIVHFGTDALAGLGVEGEIAVRSPSITSGYWRNPDATAAALRDGWLHTGDIGVLDERGCLHFLGRRKEMLKVKGMSVFPAEVEALLSGHPAIKAVAVVPRIDRERGEIPVAFVELLSPTDDATATAVELRAWAEGAMATYKVPDIRIVMALPRTDTGKIKKGELIARVQVDGID